MAVKQEFAEKQKVKWLETWKTSPHYARFQHIDVNFPFNKFQKISKVLSRVQTSLLTQLWTGHIPLNSYLFHIKKSGTRRCKSCWGIGQLAITETVIHFLFECQAYAAERYDMDRALGRYSRDLQGILATLGRIKELLKFVGRMERFKNTLGDSIGEVSFEPKENWQVAPLLLQTLLWKHRMTTAELASSQWVCPKTLSLFSYPHLSHGLQSSNQIMLGQTPSRVTQETATHSKPFSFVLPNHTHPNDCTYRFAVRYLVDETLTTLDRIVKQNAQGYPARCRCVPKQCFRARLCGGMNAMGVPSSVQGMVSGGLGIKALHVLGSLQSCKVWHGALPQ